MKTSKSRICGVQLSSAFGDAARQLCIEFYARCIFACNVTVRCLGGDGKPLTTNCPSCKQPQRQSMLLQVFDPNLGRVPVAIRKRIGRAVAYGRLILVIPEALIQRSQKVSLTFDATSFGGSDFVGPQSMIMERLKCDMSLGLTPTPQYGFPITEDEIETRVNWLFQHYPYLRRDSDAASDGATKLWLSLRGGYDSPLLDFTTVKDQLNRTVGGAIKNADQELGRAQWTSFGLGRNGRNVTRGDSLDFVADRPSDDPLKDCEFRKSRERAIVLRQIHAFTQDAVYVELIVRRLFGDEQIIDLARELQIGYANARSVVYRAKRFLGLK